MSWRFTVDDDVELPEDIFRADDGSTFTEKWASPLERAVPLRPPDMVALGTSYVLNDIRLAFRHATKNARYIGTMVSKPLAQTQE